MENLRVNGRGITGALTAAVLMSLQTVISETKVDLYDFNEAKYSTALVLQDDRN
jgi:hypothetical protein